MIDNIIEVVKETETAITPKAEAAITTIAAEEATKVSLRAVQNLCKEEEVTAEEEVVIEAGIIKEAAVSRKDPPSLLRDQDKRVHLCQITLSW